MALPLCVGRALRENSQSPSSIVAASNAAQACWRRRSVYVLPELIPLGWLVSAGGISEKKARKCSAERREMLATVLARQLSLP